ncbi:tRNA (N6-isopentenyl adenosine(37)-C2)-methylthiotransferase MiaB [Edaphocola aurantiacus]|uniref:tRNA (N6-isopentenyl adenosine(37)-C2)-methylthiotransferase MiaB n=1 Tax=Edaphocola aurantiacus TaxID=2601682 RepID=UPI001C941731|nr:tRNA (N6-isopentenyl adenosine(37)-C2)-methylthiotransferase MiaB [Edaphocola aurantiacus]
MLETHNKTMDEARQGEAYGGQLEAEKKFEKHFYIESYGCAMNFNDSEIVASILNEHGFGATKIIEDANLVLVNTCSIREKAEQTVRNRLVHFKGLKKNRPDMLVGVLGCMAERLKAKLLEEEKLVDLVIGPDAYRTLPNLIAEAETGQKGVNVLLSREETYADIAPIRLDSNGVSSFVSIMRGCNNMCTFCVVPFTRGRERSRDPQSILREVQDLVDRGYKEVTLLGQNVDSYYHTNDDGSEVVNFARLLELVALVSPKLRVRFSTSHPKDITDEVLFTMKKYDNICNNIHLPVQSGSTRVLQLMNRTYTKEWYLKKVDRIREIIPDCAITCDIICGFCTETEEDHQETLEVMAYSNYDLSYMYIYSERPGTLAARRYADDVPDEVKSRRLDEVIALQRKMSAAIFKRDIGKTYEVLIENTSKRSEEHWSGRNSQSRVIVFPKGDYNLQKGDYATVKVTDATSGTLIGEIVAV